MGFQKIDYLNWARQFMSRTRYDLAKSNVQAITKKELELSLDDIQLAGPHEEGCDELYDLLARKYGVRRENVYVCNGASQGIFLVLSAMLDPGDQVLLETPSYEPLFRVPHQLGADIKLIERRYERGFQIDLEEVERRVSKSCAALVMTNLHNPSGAGTNADKMLTLGQILRDAKGYVLSSEVYLDSALTAEYKPAAACGQNMISLGSLSKVYGLGGVRGGWIIAHEEVIQKVKVVADYISGGTAYTTETITLFALKKADELLTRTKEITGKNFARIREWVEGREDLDWFEPDGGTVALIKLPRGVEALKLSNLAREKYSTLVVPGDFFSMRDVIRVSCGVQESTLEAGLQHLTSAIDELLASSR